MGASCSHFILAVIHDFSLPKQHELSLIVSLIVYVEVKLLNHLLNWCYLGIKTIKQIINGYLRIDTFKNIAIFRQFN